MKSLFTSTLFIALLTLVSCSSGGDQYQFNFTDIELQFEEPLFEGPNSANVQIENALLNFCTENNLNPSSISNVKIESAKLQMLNDENFDNFQNVLIQLVSKESGFTEIAGLSPIDKSITQIDVPIAQKAKLDNTFSSKTFTMVVDGNLFEDSESSYFLKADLAISFTAKSK
jgi:hypothetical protein